jgi:hypothetical protein
MFRLLRSLHIVFKSDCNSLHYHSSAVYKGSFYPTSSPAPVVRGVFDDAILTGVRCYLSVGFFFNYSYVHTILGSFLPPAPIPSLTTHHTSSLSPLTPSIPGTNYFALISNFVEERV